MARAAVRHILVKNLNEAKEIKKKLDKGDDFEKLAKKYSQCPSGKSKGGHLGEVVPGQTVRPFDRVVFKKEILVIHGPIKTQFGYHLLQTLYRDD